MPDNTQPFVGCRSMAGWETAFFVALAARSPVIFDRRLISWETMVLIVPLFARYRFMGVGPAAAMPRV